LNTKNFGGIAQKLARNPLGIIALFIVLIYGIACLTFGFSKNLPASWIWCFILFIAGYPLIVLFVFYQLVTKHHTKLYAPGDFPLPENFMECINDTSKKWSNDSNIKSIIETGYIYYTLSDLNPRLLDHAIDWTNQALQYQSGEYLECFAKNNLAFYHAIKGKDEDDDVKKARELSEFVFDKSYKYLVTKINDAIEWQMTRAYVMAKHPINLEQKEGAKKIYQSLLERKDISLDQANRIKEHMKNFWPS